LLLLQAARHANEAHNMSVLRRTVELLLKSASVVIALPPKFRQREKVVPHLFTRGPFDRSTVDGLSTSA
jgi:hypothetical protein